MAADKIEYPTDHPPRVIGASVTRLEDAPLVRGQRALRGRHFVS